MYDDDINDDFNFDDEEDDEITADGNTENAEAYDIDVPDMYAIAERRRAELQKQKEEEEKRGRKQSAGNFLTR